MSQPVLPDVVALRPFVPAKDFEVSFRFYVDLGFTATRLTAALASVQLGPFGFLLQEFEAEGFAGNFMMQLLVRDLATWWASARAEADPPLRCGMTNKKGKGKCRSFDFAALRMQLGRRRD